MGLIPMANKELANQWNHGCMHGMYAWNDLGTPTILPLAVHRFMSIVIINHRKEALNSSFQQFPRL